MSASNNEYEQIRFYTDGPLSANKLVRELRTVYDRIPNVIHDEPLTITYGMGYYKSKNFKIYWGQSFTDTELEAAEKSKNGFIGERNGVKFYLQSNFK